MLNRQPLAWTLWLAATLTLSMVSPAAALPSPKLDQTQVLCVHIAFPPTPSQLNLGPALGAEGLVCADEFASENDEQDRLDATIEWSEPLLVSQPVRRDLPQRAMVGHAHRASHPLRC